MLRPRASMMIFTHLLVTLIVVVIIDNGAQAHLDVAEMDFETDQDRPMMLDGSAQSLAIATSSGIQCDSIKVELCKHMEYPSTMMPNFFNDLNQIDANQRARYYRGLIESDCNRHISTYLCQLITPVCLDQDPDIMSRFKILPCRPFCRRMKRDCSKEILKLDRELENHLAPAFDCDQLPYEINMGNLTSADKDGPCHDPFAGSISNSNQYKPFDRSLDDPYITDNSPMDAWRPISGAKQPASAATATATANQGAWTEQLSGLAQSVIRFSNIISIITVLVLLAALAALAALNAKRLRRLASTSSASSSSSSSSSSSAPLNCGGCPGGSAGYHSALARQQQIYSNILLSSPSHQVLLLNDASQQSGARAKLMPLIGGGGGCLTSSPSSRPAPPQSRAPPVPAPSSSGGFASSISSSDRHSAAGCGDGGGYDSPALVGQHHYHLSASESLRRPAGFQSHQRRPLFM